MYHNDNLMSVYSLLFGHQAFLNKNTGLTIDRDKQHYVFNPDGVLSNNRHTIGYTRLESQPNGDATTEGQSLQILGYLYVYSATKDKYWLDKAIWCFDAYIDHFYQGQEIPDPPHDRWLCQWIINGKEPTLANWPINFDAPTHSGFTTTEINFTNGVCQIPHGAPLWGEYLDVVTQAYRGELSYPNMNARVVGYAEDGTIDWDSSGESVALDWLVDLLGRKINSNGDVLEEKAKEPKGYVKMQSPINGTWKLCHANIQPVEHGGYLMGRNTAWHNRPLNVPVVDPENYGNAADAEEWFCEASYMLWKITGERKYWLVWRNTALMCLRYADIDSGDKFFRQSTLDKNPFTDGISYEYHYPKEPSVLLDRDSRGYIRIKTDGATAVTLEQQSISKKIDKNSKITVNVGGLDASRKPLQVKVDMVIVSQKGMEIGSMWALSLPDTPMDGSIAKHEFNVGSLIQRNQEIEYLTVNDVGISAWGKTDVSYFLDSHIIDERSSVVQRLIMGEGAGASLGFWSTTTGDALPRSFTYKSAKHPWDITIADANNWRWYWVLPATNNRWSTISLTPESLVLSYYQPDHTDEEIRPVEPTLKAVTSVNIGVNDFQNDNVSELVWYCFNEMPAGFDDINGWTYKFSVTLSGPDGFEGFVGDCDISYNDLNRLAYTPGVIPFSNNSTKDISQFDAWRGLPYPGYQHPFIYVHEDNAEKHLENMCQFLLDSQKAYKAKFNLTGPGAAAYVWNRWDNLDYGDADTFIFKHWGDDAWSGYQPRAFASAARAWNELINANKPVPATLIQYVENWIPFLINFFDKVGGFPCEFPAESTPVEEKDFVGHMSGLWLCGLCFAAMSGYQHEKLDWLIEQAVTEIMDNYKVVSAVSPMNGCWSPAVRPDSDNGMFYGFWSGEILRGLGTYILYKNGEASL
ncbi:hypothetical protein CHI95_00190 [Providencia rettgeri]|uniref:Phage tail protein n=1 Tax=Providencia rettgeri TaxID=587 RepID=A0A264VY71_PRORE|nr:MULTISPECIES: hypothetical protein [Providencia]MBQ0533483.1 hypothetical protein [Providencia huaxiensis]MBQ0587040.1 hypothetical protein [Providencia huaxiensis]MDI7238278.1 hypothetical protein [Providencia huaxiensis]OZS76291.1 hypothetical protein CHI95_00190 [Providencia rettgeri]